MEENLTIRYFGISWMSRYDGPGHRVVLFLQGCNLRCTWCHSPHSQPNESPLLFFSSRCRFCGRCQEVCDQKVHEVTNGRHTLSRTFCTRCGKCLDVCPVSHGERQDGALVLPTREKTVREIWQFVYPQLDLLRNIGGLTVSGGEALLQSQALAVLFQLCHDEGIHVAVETSGAISSEHLMAVIDRVDCWLYGLRPTPVYEPPHPERITKNLAFLAEKGRTIIVRMPVLSGITDGAESLEHVVRIMKDNRLRDIQLMPFNSETSHYYHAMGMECRVGSEALTSPENLQRVRHFFEQNQLSVTLIQ